MNRVLWLAVVELHRHPARQLRRVQLQRLRAARQQPQPLGRLAPPFVLPNAAQNQGAIAQLAGHHGKIGRRAAQLRSRRQQIPKQLTNSQDQMRFLQSRKPPGSRQIILIDAVLRQSPESEIRNTKPAVILGERAANALQFGGAESKILRFRGLISVSDF